MQSYFDQAPYFKESTHDAKFLILSIKKSEEKKISKQGKKQISFDITDLKLQLTVCGFFRIFVMRNYSSKNNLNLLDCKSTRCHFYNEIDF